jgi:hypothetical protein
VTIVGTPEVRDVVEDWVLAEPRCTGQLEVRIVATDGGYDVFARDGAGRTRERVVLDVQSAGALIASWAADDAPPAPSPLLVPGVPLPAPVVYLARRTYRWGGGVSLAYVTRGSATHGWRAEADIVGRGPVSVGVSLSRTAFELPLEGGATTLFGLDTRATAYSAGTFHRGRLSLRLGLGLGAMQTGGTVNGFSIEDTGWKPIGELTLQAGLEVGRWSLTAGAITTLIDQTWTTWNEGAIAPVDKTKRRGDVLALLGVRYRL